MYITGSFANQQGDTVTVHIVTGADKSEVLEIGSEESGLYFTDDPVDIVSEVNDTFDHLLRRSAKVRLLSRSHMPDLFSTSCREAAVNVVKGAECVFAGFIEPMALSQPYNEIYDELELNCVDALSALQYSKYKDVGGLGIIYEAVKANAGQCTFLDIMFETLGGVASRLDLTGTFGGAHFLYDGSKALDSSTSGRYDTLLRLAVSELLFLGDTEDDVWTQQEVLEEMMRLLDLHVMQDGLTFYIFSWQTVHGEDNILWSDLQTGQTLQMVRGTVDITNTNVADCDTTLTVGEVYNRLVLTCDIVEVENVVESPLDTDALTSPYDYCQKYMTEYSADNAQTFGSINAFYAMIHGEETTYGEGEVTDWYVQVKDNPKWTFLRDGRIDIVEEFCFDGRNQQLLPNYLSNGMGCALLSVGSRKVNMAAKDNSPQASITMTDCLVMSLTPTEEDSEKAAEFLSGMIQQSIPYAVYEGAASGGTFSPADDGIVNYIVIKGRIVLNPVMHMTGTFKELHLPDNMSWITDTVPSRNHGSRGRYLTRQYWRKDVPDKNIDDVEWDFSQSDGFVPFTGEVPEQYEYKYSAVGDGTDQVSKVAVVACMLTIGQKVCVEKTPDDDLGTGVPYTGKGEPEDFVWMDYKTLDDCGGDEDEYYRQSFTIGFDPKIGDKLIGVEYDLQNNHDYLYGIETEGIAIPMQKADKLSGQVTFKLLGPVNTLWNEYTRRHKTFFRSVKWTEKSVPLLNHVSSIIIKQLEIIVTSDSQSRSGETGNDVVYMSDTRENFTNSKDDLEFKLSSDLTLDDCRRLGVTTGAKLSTPVDTVTGNTLLTIYDFNRHIEAKPEQLYVDAYYTEYHQPRIVLEQHLLEGKAEISPFAHYRHPALSGKTFFVQGISRNLMEGRADLTLKEIPEEES